MLNRLLILVMLLALLFALYKYQQYMPSDNNKSGIKDTNIARDRIRTINYRPFVKNEIENDIITTDCISQKSINSLSDIQSNIYHKKDKKDKLYNVNSKLQPIGESNIGTWDDGLTELLKE